MMITLMTIKITTVTADTRALLSVGQALFQALNEPSQSLVSKVLL